MVCGGSISVGARQTCSTIRILAAFQRYWVPKPSAKLPAWALCDRCSSQRGSISDERAEESPAPCSSCTRGGDAASCASGGPKLAATEPAAAGGSRQSASGSGSACQTRAAGKRHDSLDRKPRGNRCPSDRPRGQTCERSEASAVQRH